jgi:hypothetical protein
MKEWLMFLFKRGKRQEEEELPTESQLPTDTAFEAAATRTHIRRTAQRATEATDKFWRVRRELERLEGKR